MRRRQPRPGLSQPDQRQMNQSARCHHSRRPLGLSRPLHWLHWFQLQRFQPMIRRRRCSCYRHFRLRQCRRNILRRQRQRLLNLR